MNDPIPYVRRKQPPCLRTDRRRPQSAPTPGDDERAEAGRFYASARWRKLRAAYLAGHPLCEDCKARGYVTSARHVHHIVPRKKAPHLAYEWCNLQALCMPCHNACDER